MLEIKARGAESAEILIYDDIGEDMFGGISAKSFAEEIKALGNVRRLDVRINSMGGNVFDGIAIYNTLMQNPAQVNVQIDGLAASIASVIAMAGDKISIADTGFMMIHDPWAMVVGSAKELRETAESLDRVQGSLVKAYQRHSSLDAKQLSDYMAAETWFDAEEALSIGLATDIWQAPALAAHGDIGKYKYRNTPKQIVDAVGEKPRAKMTAEKIARMRKTLHSLKL